MSELQSWSQCQQLDFSCPGTRSSAVTVCTVKMSLRSKSEYNSPRLTPKPSVTPRSHQLNRHHRAALYKVPERDIRTSRVT